MAAKLYTVHFSPFGAGPDRDARFVKEGFSWAAFLFGPFWAFYHRLWLAGFLLIAMLAALALAGEFLLFDPIADTVFGLALAVLVGFEGPDWLRRKLADRGLIERGFASGRNLAEAERDWFRRRLGAVR
jgi:hypothetical protein